MQIQILNYDDFKALANTFGVGSVFYHTNGTGVYQFLYIKDDIAIIGIGTSTIPPAFATDFPSAILLTTTDNWSFGTNFAVIL